MATNYVDFLPTPSAPFQFQTVLDGAQYTVTVTYNVFGQRYYVNLYTVQGALVLSTPMVGSPDEFDLPLTQNKFVSTILFRKSKNRFEISDQPLSSPLIALGIPLPIPAQDIMLNQTLGEFILDQSVMAGTPGAMLEGFGEFVLDKSLVK